MIDDSDDDALTDVIARENRVPSPNFGGLWGSRQKDEHRLVAFQLVQRGGGMVRKWYSDRFGRELIEAILDVPHFVSIMPAEIAGDAATLEALIPASAVR